MKGERPMRSDERPDFKPLRVMLVDDHEVVRNGLRMMLETEGDIRVVAEAGSGRGAVAKAQRTKPDAIRRDVRLIDGSRIGGTPEIRAARPQAPGLMLISFVGA